MIKLLPLAVLFLIPQAQASDYCAKKFSRKGFSYVCKCAGYVYNVSRSKCEKYQVKTYGRKTPPPRSRVHPSANVYGQPNSRSSVPSKPIYKNPSQPSRNAQSKGKGPCANNVNSVGDISRRHHECERAIEIRRQKECKGLDMLATYKCEKRIRKEMTGY